MSAQRLTLWSLVIALSFWLFASPSHAQLNLKYYALSPNKYCWSENAGFLNFRAYQARSSAVLARPGLYMAGYAWGENIGWVNLGNVPADMQSYQNTTVFLGGGGSVFDYGVNVAYDGVQTNTFALVGFAWGENVGWVNFGGGALASPPKPALLDIPAHRRGYAWSENLGWINLDDPNIYVSFYCPADFNFSGTVTTQDLFDFLAAWFAHDLSADINSSGLVTVQDLFDFLVLWFSHC